ncbi:MAG TPA: hypothetical protein VHE35_23380 [Kofleriaceae bacterium]|nr:hypothetical protein [Kofleriaceae bacterium]
MPDVDDRRGRLSGGPELLSIVVVLLVAILVAAALRYSWVGGGERALETPPAPAGPSAPAPADHGELR